VALVDSRGNDVSIGTDVSIERNLLEAAGIEFVIGTCASDDEVVEVAERATCILTMTHQFSADLLDRLPKLRGIVRYGVGVDNIDLGAATSRGIVACNVADYCIDEVSNHAFALLLAVNRRLLPLDRIVREPDHAKAATNLAAIGHVGPIRGETLGLVAFGPIARSVAQKALGFGLRVVVHDPFVDPALVEGMVGEAPVALDELLVQSDYISVHVPAGASTIGMVGAAELARCKPTAIIVLTSRGGVVDEQALYEALRDGRLSGAGVDVWDPEPAGPDKPLASLDNVIVTPHYGFYSERSKILLRERVAESAVDVVTGIIPRSVVNRDVLAKLDLRVATGR